MFASTQRATPGSADAVGHQLLLRAGYLRQLGQGIFSYLPLGWRSMRKIADVMRAEMDAVGGVELSMPVVHPADIWRQSGRYTKIGAELARFKDRRDRDMVLAMTHEEVVAGLAASEIQSYRQLPKLIYQVQLKFRDDPRPRAGLIRGREFTMKDAYSLDVDEAGLDLAYGAQYQAYFNIFNRCRLPVIAVGADVGMMGGTLAHEYMYLTALGEDTLVLCDNCGYAQNRQVATVRKPAVDNEEPAPIEKVATPGTSTIEALCRQLGVGPARTAKMVFMMAEAVSNGSTGAERPLAVVVRGDTTVNETKLANAVGAGDLRPLTLEEIGALGAVAGFASPIGLVEATVVVDDLVAASPNLVAGANETGYHLLNTNVGRDYQPDIVADITAAEEGDACVVCGHAVRTTRGVEVGNIFKLGTRYSAAFDATFVDAEGRQKPIVMGCYGIGVGRLLACVAEEHHDDRGLKWPVTIAPYHVYMCTLGGADSPAMATANRVYDELTKAGVEVLYDDRGERPGVQFADCDLIGLPLRLTIGDKSLAKGGVEVKARDEAESALVGLDEILADVVGRLQRMHEAVATTVIDHPLN